MLHDFVSSNRADLINRCRQKVAKRSSHVPVADGHGVPLFLLQLIYTLHHEQLTTIRNPSEPEPTPAATEIGRAAALHGAELLRHGYSLDQVVHDYGDVCQAVTDLAVEQNSPVTADEFRTLNRCLDNAIADAVTAYARGHNAAMSGQAALWQRRVFAGNEARRLINEAIQTYAALQTVDIGMTGMTGTALLSTLCDLRDLLNQAAPDRRRDEV